MDKATATAGTHGENLKFLFNFILRRSKVSDTKKAGHVCCACACAPLGHLILHSNLFRAKGIFYCALCFNFLTRRCRNNGYHAPSLLAIQLHCFLPHLFSRCHCVCARLSFIYNFSQDMHTHSHTPHAHTCMQRASCQRGKILRMCHILSQIFTA